MENVLHNASASRNVVPWLLFTNPAQELLGHAVSCLDSQEREVSSQLLCSFSSLICVEPQTPPFISCFYKIFWQEGRGHEEGARGQASRDERNGWWGSVLGAFSWW